MALLDKIDTPELLLTAAETVNELFSGQNGEKEEVLKSFANTIEVLLSRISSRQPLLRKNYASSKNGSAKFIERCSGRESLSVIGTQTALFSATVSFCRLRQESGMSSIFDSSNGETSDEDSGDLFGTIAIGANEQEGCLSLAGSHLNMWSKQLPAGSSDKDVGAAKCVSPPFFCRCMQASFSVLELVSKARNEEEFVSEIDVLKLSPFGARPHRKKLLSRFIFQSLLQHVFSMGSYDGTTGHGFRRVQKLLLDKMSLEDVMSLFATFWFDETSTSEIISTKAMSRSGSVSGPATSSAAARWLFECTLKREFCNPSGKPKDDSAFGVLMQRCIHSTDLLKALLLAHICSQAWSQPVTQGDIVNVNDRPHLFRSFKISVKEAHVSQTKTKMKMRMNGRHHHLQYQDSTSIVVQIKQWRCR